MLKIMGATGVVMTSDRAVSHSAIEDALHEQGFLDGYTIHIEPHRDQLMISIQVSVPTGWITAAGVPELPAEQVLRSLTAAVQKIDKVTEELSTHREVKEVTTAEVRSGP